MKENPIVEVQCNLIHRLCHTTAPMPIHLYVLIGCGIGLDKILQKRHCFKWAWEQLYDTVYSEDFISLKREFLQVNFHRSPT